MLTRTEETNHTAAEATRPNALQFDPAKYRSEVDRFDITEEQKQELLLVLWDIMRSFVDLGFTVDVCGAVLADPTPDAGEAK